ncbi:hypothetical protein [Granulicella sp. dw_53]|uniref:hypothetical protein n=1 Tax=Granulicella sp. dw_53 TaxID=2719792 RepID=UPI001BD29A1A|nr:hypothetical protein [Granulicella sp. dw_53]
MLKEYVHEILSKPATHAYVKRYVQLHNIGSTQDDPEGRKIDSIGVLGFSSLNDVEDYLSNADYAQVEREESALIGGGSEFWTAATTALSTAYPELATESKDGE